MTSLPFQLGGFCKTLYVNRNGENIQGKVTLGEAGNHRREHPVCRRLCYCHSQNLSVFWKLTGAGLFGEKGFVGKIPVYIPPVSRLPYSSPPHVVEYPWICWVLFHLSCKKQISKLELSAKVHRHLSKL